MHLIRTRWKQPNLVVISGTEATCEFDFNQLQLDIINEYILKKPLIADPRINMRMKFVFLKKGPPQLCIPSLEHISIKDTPWVSSKNNCIVLELISEKGFYTIYLEGIVPF